MKIARSIHSPFSINQTAVRDFFATIVNSYSQIFFSTHKPFALLIMLVTFFDFYTGLFGLVAVLTSAITGHVLKFDLSVLRNGLLGFNSLLVGLGLGVYFSPTLFLLGIVILASLFTFLISVSLQGVVGKYGLPFLSIPFIIALWAFMLASNSFSVLGLNERGIFTINELYTFGGQSLVDAYHYMNNLNIPDGIRAYLISLSAILFHYNLLTGLILSIGLLLFSRIAFSLSLIGFFLAYAFYHLIGAEITVYDYTYFGFNYILSSIALGGFFLIPSRNSYLWMILLIPLVAILTISLNSVFYIFHLSIYSLPFNMVVLLFLYALKFRNNFSYQLTEVFFQHNSPEKNLYIFLNNKERFRYKFFTPIKLPFFGTWKVSQAHNGEYTHQGLYQHAWDFVIENTEGKQYKNSGDFPEDYFCYGKPVLAPEKGIIEEVLDGIDDNTIGQNNLHDNWGNTIIIKHENDIYSKLSHLKKGSIQVNKGDEVHFGQIIAHCGNSGRSPYPHLHFQIQAYPFIGSVTMDYPLSNYIEHRGDNFDLLTHSKPQNNELVSNIETTSLLASALDFIPGQVLNFELTDGSVTKEISFEVQVNEFNQSYIYCQVTGAKAFFENDTHLFYFTYFEGSKSSYLYYVFLAIFKSQTGFYKGLEVADQLPLYLTYPKIILWFHDFISPFILLIKSEFKLRCEKINDSVAPSHILLVSTLSNYFLKKKLNEIQFTIHIGLDGIDKIEVVHANRNIVFKR